jgi:CRISPR/Cas system-associated protein Csx1
MIQSDNNAVTMTYSSLLLKDGKKAICVRFERKTLHEIHYAEAFLPDYKIQKQSGFSEDEILHLEDYLKINKDFILEESKKISNIMNWF